MIANLDSGAARSYSVTTRANLDSGAARSYSVTTRANLDSGAARSYGAAATKAEGRRQYPLPFESGLWRSQVF